jgi:hypothetical protein
MRHRLLLLVAATFAALVMVPSALPVTVLTGIFKTKITGKSSALNGTWFFKIDQFTKFTLKKNGKLYVTGTAAGAAGKLAIADTGGPAACKGVQAAGAYTYTLSGNQLKLKATFDQCSGRKTILTAHSLTKVGN